ncbi:hypothetical protein DRJ00_08165 [Candidatus Aerophobetes bacterium]|uniref:IclR-ED domain-containing protein n=1 Tax=Aerophobetes bacterium TaxID=2030807 RepID=A0A497E2N0_UNCAE|nr:MAG: hypothetical protein DRJ00_08165 [Candidatus Aerophobetes bacterium]
MRDPLHRSAAGKAILAYLPLEEVDQIIKEKGLARYTEKNHYRAT